MMLIGGTACGGTLSTPRAAFDVVEIESASDLIKIGGDIYGSD